MSAAFHSVLGGKRQAFRLGLDQLQELQTACNAGPATIFGRLMSSQPQAASHKRPEPQGYDLGAEDLDYIRDLATYSLLRNIGGDWRVEDVRETIRLGLIGAGATPTDAFIAVSTYVDRIDRYPLVDNASLAAAILHYALTAPEGETVGKPIAEKATEPVTG